MIEVKRLKVNGKVAIGVKVDLPDSPPLISIIGEEGFIMCGFLNVEVAESFGIMAAVVSGVRTFEDVLDAEVKQVTSRAKARGIRQGMKGREVVELL
jgi:uncharacterized protein YunC (DUF1805 family)